MGNTTTKHHPLTGAPIVPLGYRKDGRPIMPIMGGDDTVPPADPPAPTDPPPADPPADPAPAHDGKGGKDAILADLAKERDKRQALEQSVADMQATQQAQMDALAKALGIKPDDTPPDPEKLTQEVTAAQEQARVAQRELAVYRLAGTHEGNASELLDSASFLASIKDVDPTDQAAMEAAIKAAIESNPKFKASTTSPTPPFPGGPRTPAPKTAGSLGEAIAGRFAGNNR